MPALINKKTKLKVQNKKLRFALIGNPNAGKTTLFNHLTGSRQYVGNWPGVTVEKKEGSLDYKGKKIEILDLPGIYSLSPYSSEEIITRNCLLTEDIDLIINIVDATNLERNLYLSTQIMELGLPMVIVLNMIDILEKRGHIINYDILKKELNIPVIPISASKGTGISELLDLSINFTNKNNNQLVKKIYSYDLEKVLFNIETIIENTHINHNVNPRWYSVKIFEDDEIIYKKIKLNSEQNQKINELKNSIKYNEENIDRQMIIADQRYKFICDLCSKVIKKSLITKVSTTDKIDKIVTHKFLALPIFLSLMFLIFFITFGPVGNFLKDNAQFFITNILGKTLENALNYSGASMWVKSLLLGGIIEGVGSVISFLPQIALLFLLLCILEDSGYMARAAFITDKLLKKIGLSGKAFVPLLMGFGCSVPAILGTRILEKDKDKKLTILMIPFMSCSAKMPVYAMFISTFFQKNQPLIIFSIYSFGIILAIITALIFKNTILKGETASFILELPEYKFPTPKNLFLHVWERVKDFLTKAGTVLLGAAIVIWFLQSFDFSFHMISDSSKSILASIGTFIAPIFTLCGFNDWKTSVSLVCGIIAKESVLSTMAVLYNVESKSNLTAILHQHFNAISAYSFMIFVLLYTPCVAALSAIKKELKSLKWTIGIMLYQIAVAWFASCFVYQFLTLFFKLIRR